MQQIPAKLLTIQSNMHPAIAVFRSLCSHCSKIACRPQEHAPWGALGCLFASHTQDPISHATFQKAPVYLKPQTAGKHGTSRPNNHAGAVQATSYEHLLALAARASAGASWGADWAPRRSRALATRAALRAWKPNCRTKASWVTSRPSSPYRNCTTVLQTPREDLVLRPQPAGCCLCADGMSTHLHSMQHTVGGSCAWSPAFPCLPAC